MVGQWQHHQHFGIIRIKLVMTLYTSLGTTSKKDSKHSLIDYLLFKFSSNSLLILNCCRHKMKSFLNFSSHSNNPLSSFIIWAVDCPWKTALKISIILRVLGDNSFIYELLLSTNEALRFFLCSLFCWIDLFLHHKGWYLKYFSFFLSDRKLNRYNRTIW